MTAGPAPFGPGDLNAFVDGHIRPERGAALAQWLSKEPRTRARVDAWKRHNEALRTMFASVVFEPVPVRLLPTTLAKPRVTVVRSPEAAAGETSDAAMPEGGPSRHRTKAAAMTLAAFLCGLALAWGAARLGFDPFGEATETATVSTSGVRLVASRASEAHQTFATDLNHPVEIPASDEAHLVRWIQHRLSMPIRIPDLRPQGWTLVGGRIVPGELGPAAFLIYGNGVERLGLYVARTNGARGDGFIVSADGTGPGSVAAWIDEPFGYALTSSRGRTWMDRNVGPLYGSVRAQARDTASAF